VEDGKLGKRSDVKGVRFTVPKDWKPWALIASGALIGLAFVWRHRADTLATLVGDAGGYHKMGLALLQEGKVFPGLEPPGYPAYVAAVYAITGGHPVAIYLSHLLLLAVTLLVVYNIALLVTANQATALITIGLCAVWLPFQLYAAKLLTETLSGLLVAVVIWNILVLLQRPTVWRTALLGMLLGFLLMVKFVGVVVVAAVLWLVLASKEKWGRKAALAGLVAAIVIGMVTPWFAFNRRQVGDPMPVALPAFWMGNYPGHYVRAWDYKTFPRPLDRMVGCNFEQMIQHNAYAEKSPILLRAALGYMQENPVRALGIFAFKFSQLWLGGLGRNPGMYGDRLLASVGSFGVPRKSPLYIVIFALAVVGLRIARRERWQYLYPVMLVVGLWTLVFVITVAEEIRYVLPVQFYGMMLAAAALERVFARLSRRRVVEQPNGPV
jgi:4-amino-4-deoxy-L-arabinose transferase-like glycosyltransferase